MAAFGIRQLPLRVEICRPDVTGSPARHDGIGWRSAAISSRSPSLSGGHSTGSSTAVNGPPAGIMFIVSLSHHG